MLQLYFGSIELEAVPTRSPTPSPTIKAAIKRAIEPVIEQPIAKEPVGPEHPYRIAVVSAFWGGLPPWFRTFTASCETSRHVADFLIFTKDTRIEDLPSNVKVIALGRERFAELHAKAAGDPGLQAALVETFQRNPRQLVEFKPAIGVIFSEYLTEYSHWAFGDVDVLFGDLDSVISSDELENYDVVTYSFGDQFRAYTRGQWTLHRNIRKVNRAYESCHYLTTQLRRRLEKRSHYESCEGCYSLAVRDAGLRVKFAVKALTDSTNPKFHVFLTNGQVRTCSDDDCRPLKPTATEEEDDRGLLRRRREVPEKKKKRCMGWVNPKYQPCLNLAQKDAPTIILENGTYYQIPQKQRQSHALMHFQEWKKKWLSFSAQPPPRDGSWSVEDFKAFLDKRPVSRDKRGSLNLVVTKFGFVPLPSVRPPEFSEERLRYDIDDAVPQSTPRMYCAFKSCASTAIEASDFSILLAVPSVDKLSRPKEAGVSLAQVVHVVSDAVVANACGWPGPMVVVLVGATEISDKVRDEITTCRRSSFLMIGMPARGAGKAALNAALDLTVTRFALALRTERERVSPGTYDAITSLLRDKPRGTTLVLPVFDAQMRPTALCGSDPALSDTAYAAWFRNESTNSLLRKPITSNTLAINDAAPVLVLDALDDRGDPRLVRELEELGGVGCYDAAFLRSLGSMSHRDEFLRLATHAFITLDDHNTTCGCPEGVSWSKTLAFVVQSYAGFLAKASELRTLADDEARHRQTEAQNLLLLEEESEHHRGNSRDDLARHRLQLRRRSRLGRLSGGPPEQGMT